MLRIIRAVVVGTAGLGLAVGSVVPIALTAVPAWAQADAGAKAKAAKKAAKAKAKASAEQTASSSETVDPEAALDKARRALAEGKTDAALGLAESVLGSTSKDARNTARALAVRGEGRLKQGRTAEALADLENALWVKGGVAGAERESAVAARAQALQSSGLPASPPPAPSAGPSTAAAAPSGRSGAPAARAASNAPPPAPTPVSTSEPLRPWDTSNPNAPRPRPVPAPLPAQAPERASAAAATVAPAPPPAAPPRVASAPPQPTQPAVAAPVVTHGRAPVPVPPPTPAPVPQASASESSGGLGSFLGNIFGGSGSQASAESERQPRSPPTTATIPAARPVQPSVSSSPPQRGDESVQAAPRARASAAVAAAPRPAAVAPPAAAADPASTGDYKIQLAAVRSREEAEALASAVKKDEAGAVGARGYQIVEDVYGNMGRFYRVRISGFAPTEAMALCSTLRRKQMDCMVLDQ